MTYRFDEITRSRRLSGKCAAGCGRRLTRTVTARQTINPFNLIEDGSRPKTRDEVAASVSAQLETLCATWHPVCTACGNAVGMKR